MPILEKLVPTAQLVFDPNLNQLHANATPTQHTMIQTDPGPDSHRRFDRSRAARRGVPAGASRRRSRQRN